MLTLRLPDDDTDRRGLAERAASFDMSPADAGLSTTSKASLSAEPDLSSGLDPEEMERQLVAACRHGGLVEAAAARSGLMPSTIAGLCSRRSGWGRCLSPIGPDGTRNMAPRRTSTDGRNSSLPPDGLGFERGLMGLDFDDQALARGFHWRDPALNIDAACAAIIAHRTQLRRSTTLQGTGLLRAALAAFECGLGPVQRAVRLGQDVDVPTMGRDGQSIGCGWDVLVRASFFQAHGWD